MAATNLNEYYKSLGQALPSLSSRAKIYSDKGLTGTYTGSTAQNNALLAALQSGGATTPTGTSTPATGAPAPSGGGFSVDMLNTAYQKLLGRAPDPSGLAEYQKSFYAGKTMTDLEKIIMSSPEYQQRSANPANSEEVQKRLADVTSMAFDKYTTADAPTVRTADQIKADIKSELPTTEKPVAPSLEADYMKMRTDMGVDALEANATDLKSQKEELLAQYRTLVNDEQGKPILNRLITGRVAKEARAVQEQLDFITRQEAVNNDQLTSKYNIINLKMGFEQTDFQNAKSLYDSEYSNAISLINAVSTVQSKEQADLTAFKNDARANLAIYSKYFDSGQMTWDGLTPEQKTQLNKLEAQAGLGVGYLRSVQSLSGGGEVKSITTRQAPDGFEYADAITVMPDGTLKVVSTKLGAYKKASTGNPTTAADKRLTEFQNFASGLLEKMDQDGLAYSTAAAQIRAKFSEVPEPDLTNMITNALGANPTTAETKTTEASRYPGIIGSIFGKVGKG